MNKAKDLLNSDIKLVNIGLESFTEAFDEKETSSCHKDSPHPYFPATRGNRMNP